MPRPTTSGRLPPLFAVVTYSHTAMALIKCFKALSSSLFPLNVAWPCPLLQFGEVSVTAKAGTAEATSIAAISAATDKTKIRRLMIQHLLPVWAIPSGSTLLFRTYSYTEGLFFISHLLADAGSFVRL